MGDVELSGKVEGLWHDEKRKNYQWGLAPAIANNLYH